MVAGAADSSCGLFYDRNVHKAALLVLMQATVIWSAATCRRFAFPTRHFCQSAWEDSKHSISISGEIGRANERRSQSQIT